MSEEANNTEPKLIGLMAQFDDPDSLLAACEKVRKAGYTKTDAYTPFPLHGIDEALGIKPTILPWIVLTLGVMGGFAGLGLQYVTNADWYPFIISAKPVWSLPANIPVIFELVILHSAIAVFIGMLFLNKLPTFSNPLFRVPEFARATDDKFFLTIDVNDDKYKPNKTRELLDGLIGQTDVIEVFEDPSPAELPKIIKFVGIAATVVAVVPPILLWRAYYQTSTVPRINPIRDMDVQLRGDTQTISPVFADGRTMRPRIPGTVARGEWVDPIMLTGIVPEIGGEQNVIFLQEEDTPEEGADKPAEDEKPAEDKPAAEEAEGQQPMADDAPAEDKPAEEAPAAEEKPADGEAAAEPEEPEPNWVKIAPISVTKATLERGRQRYNIYCSVCHGLAGDGDGLVSQRALQLEQPTWIPPTNLHTDYLLTQPDGKLYNTITHGIRKMKGYGDQIPAEDRWAIVTYVRALQKTRTGTPEEIPAVEMKELEIKGQ
ncbi:quinol:electron acceptor oxidoreductase subunit ActD [Bremerella sp. JC770]|uniref:quinol:electron acceptor oxidoreductase subunit ActD n=1 Tax=Bremerella sp. JC770 TaxID=3232137 RepID=UPI0034595E35